MSQVPWRLARLIGNIDRYVLKGYEPLTLSLENVLIASQYSQFNPKLILNKSAEPCFGNSLGL